MRAVALLLAVVLLAAVVTAAPNNYPQGPCSEGETTEYECNTCRCAADGSGFVCTRRVCPPQGPPERRRREEPEFSCTPNESYTAPDGCNTCVCSDDGSSAACTLRLCLPTPSS